MADGGVHVRVGVFVRCPVTPRVGLKALFFCFHKHPVRLLTLLLIEALDLQLSYANYCSNLKLAPPASALFQVHQERMVRGLSCGLSG